MKSEFINAEFKLKNPDLPWEDCEIIDIINDADRTLCDKRAKELSDYYGVEVRWNWIGGNNGHYMGRAIT